LIFDSHPSEDFLEEYAFDRLSEPDCAAFEEHLLVCPRCQHNLRQTDEYIFLMKQGAMEWQSDKASRATASRSVVWRSSIAAVLGAGAVTAALAVAIPHYSWQSSPSTSPVELVALRGGEGPAMARARSGAPIGIMIDTADLDNRHGLRVAVVDANGKPVWTGDAREPAAGTRISARIDTRLRAGVYWIRLYSAGGELLREFGLRLE